MADWTPTSWQKLQAQQQPLWTDSEEYDAAVAELRTKAPLVFAAQTRALTEQLARVSQGKGFLLHAGDCAESFSEFSVLFILPGRDG